MADDEFSWRDPAFRQFVAEKIDEAIQGSTIPTIQKSIDMENNIFQNARSKKEYFCFLTRLILHVKEMNMKKGIGGQGMMEPIGSSQNMARPRTVQEPPPNTVTNHDSSKDADDVENWLASNIKSCCISENNV